MEDARQNAQFHLPSSIRFAIHSPVQVFHIPIQLPVLIRIAHNLALDYMHLLVRFHDSVIKLVVLNCGEMHVFGFRIQTTSKLPEH